MGLVIKNIKSRSLIDKKALQDEYGILNEKFTKWESSRKRRIVAVSNAESRISNILRLYRYKNYKEYIKQSTDDLKKMLERGDGLDDLGDLGMNNAECFCDENCQCDHCCDRRRK